MSLDGLFVCFHSNEIVLCGARKKISIKAVYCKPVFFSWVLCFRCIIRDYHSANIKGLEYDVTSLYTLKQVLNGVFADIEGRESSLVGKREIKTAQENSCLCFTEQLIDSEYSVRH